MEEDPLQYTLDPTLFGIPDRDELAALRIWDLHYHGFNVTDNLRNHEETMFYFERLGLERAIALDVGGTRRYPFETGPLDATLRRLLEEEQHRLSGISRIDPSDPERSVQKMEKWIRNGPCIGIKYSGQSTNRNGITCSHPNNDPIIELARELDAVVYIHTSLKVGDGSSPRHHADRDPERGDPVIERPEGVIGRWPGGGRDAGESSPMDVALLAQRFPDVPLVCGHSGHDWELSARAVRPYENIYFEFSGSWPHSGSVDLAVKELGADRIVWGGHGPSRSYATELSKVLDADISHHEKMQIFGGNVRQIARIIFQNKGYKM